MATRPRLVQQPEAALGPLPDSNAVGFLIIDRAGVVQDANKAFWGSLGYSSNEFPLPWDEKTSLPTVDGSPSIKALIQSGNPGPWEIDYLAKDGSVTPVLIGLAPIPDSDGATVGVVLNLSLHKETEQRLLKRKKQLRKLAASLVLAEEGERRRIATGLHDDIGHVLALARLKLSLLSDTGLSEAGDPIGDIRDLLDKAIKTSRSLTFELSSPVLYELGLEAAVRSFLREHCSKHGIRARFASEPELIPMDDNTRVLLYRASRELILNAVRHAKASTIWVAIESRKTTIRMSVTDDGIGFDAADAGTGFDRRGGFGLFNLRQQLDYMGGTVEIDTEPERGTRVVIDAPIA